MNDLKETSIRVHPCSSVVKKPRKIVIPLAIGLSWRADPDYVYQEKLDGRFATREIRGDLFAGELMPNGLFYVFDCLKYQGDLITSCDLRTRLAVVDALFHEMEQESIHPAMHRSVPTVPRIRRVQSAKDGGKFLAEVLARGGEGVVKKSLSAPWGATMEACKRLETFICVVTAFNAGQSVQIALTGAHRDSGEKGTGPSGSALSATSCGNVSLFGGKADRVRVGSILKIEGFGLTTAGKIREPRPCKDTPTSWLIQY